MDPKELRGLMEAYAEVYAPQEVDEAIYSEKGKAKAAEMIAKRSTPSGRAKPGKGDNVAQIRQIRGSGRGDFDKEGLGGTPMTPTMAKNPRKKQNYTGTGNKAARRAGLTPTREKPNAWKEEFDIFDIVLEFLQAEGYAETLEEAEWLMANVINEEAIDIILGEAQHARENPEKYERDQEKRTSKREKAMNDPHKGINSPAFAEFMRKQMGR